MQKKPIKKLGQILLEEGVIDSDTLEEAQRKQQETGSSLARFLLEEGHCEKEAVMEALEVQLGIQRVNLAESRPQAEAARLLPAELAEKYGAIPLKREGKRLTVAMIDPSDLIAVDDLRFQTGMEIDPVIADPEEVKSAIEEYIASPLEVAVEAMEEHLPPEEEVRDANPDRLRELTREAPIVKLADSILRHGVREQASDIHLEGREDLLRVRLRIDGQLRELLRLPRQSHAALVSRLKIMAGLDLAERRLPQDGRFQQEVAGRRVDFRLATVPTIHGEKVAIRVLDPRQGLLPLGELGFSEGLAEDFLRLLNRPYGMILVTGPTGSGKTTTLYAALRELRSDTDHIITIEEPVEYRLAGINQVQIKEATGLTFSRGLKAILRQDPDVIMVGEIRDEETARTAIQAALTGHLVLSTLHTNSAPGALTRLLDMGVEPFLVASAVVGVLAQRLLRLNCRHCCHDRLLAVEELEKMGVEPEYDQPMAVFEGKGCRSCGQTGYRRRTGIFELLCPDDRLRQLVQDQASTEALREAAVEKGMQTLYQNGLEKVITGETSLTELLRVTAQDDAG